VFPAGYENLIIVQIIICTFAWFRLYSGVSDLFNKNGLCRICNWRDWKGGLNIR